MRERKVKLEKSFINSQKEIIISRIARYESRERIKEELEANDVSGYTMYKQVSVAPNLRKVLKIIERNPNCYGVCLSCGNDIEMERLKLVPAAFLCTKCM